MAKNAVLKDLQSFSIFKGMSQGQMRLAGEMIQQKSFKKGSEIWHEGDPGDSVCLLLQGELEITRRLTLFGSSSDLESRDKSLIRLSAAQYPVIGEMALCANTPRSASLQAITDIVLGVMTSIDIQTACVQDHEFGMILYRNLASIIAHRLIETNANVLKLTTAFSLALHQDL